MKDYPHKFPKLPNPVITAEEEREIYYRGVIQQVATQIWTRNGGREPWKKIKVAYDRK